MIALIAVICIAGHCRDVVVTTSDQDPFLNMMSCQAPPALVDWLAHEWPGYTLDRWKCIIGKRGSAT